MDIEKSTTKEYFVCVTCEKKMESIKVGGSSDLFNFSGGSQSFMYCDNKECDKFGYLTVAGKKVKE